MTRAKKKTSQISSKDKTAAACPEGSRLQDCAQEASETQNVDKIREILFGNQMKDYDKRFVGLENHLQKQIKELREESQKRLDAIEIFIKKEVDALSDRLNAEQSVRSESEQKINKDIKETAKRLAMQIEQLQDKQNNKARDVQQQLLELSKDLSKEIQKNHRESSDALAQAVKELNEEKVAHTTLSEILMELAIRTSDDLAKKIDLGNNRLKNE